MWIDSLVPVRRRALKSSQEENTVHEIDLIEGEDMFRNASLTFLNIVEFILLRGPVAYYLYQFLKFICNIILFQIICLAATNKLHKH